MKSKNRIRPFRKICAAVLAAALLSGGFGTSGGVLQPEEAAAATAFSVQYDTDVFKDIPYLADEAGVSIYIEDPTAFALENATLTTSVSGVSIKSNRVTTASTNSSATLVWSDWDNKTAVSGSGSRAWKVQTGVSSTNSITLTWEDAAETQYGESLDVKMVITGLDISYVGRLSTEKSVNGYWGLKTKENGYDPRVNLAIAKTSSEGTLTFQSYGTAAADSTGTLDTVGSLTFGVDLDYHLKFYDADGNEVDGIYLMYQADVDVKDSYAYHLALAKNGWSSSGVADEDDTSWWDPDSAFIESVTFPSSTDKAYAISQSGTSSTSLIQYSGRRVSGKWSTQNQLASATGTVTDPDLIASVQAGVSAGSTMTWTGSRCTTFLFESYSPGTGTITLTKTAKNNQNIANPDLSGALYAVHQESAAGPIIGYFVTNAGGSGRVAFVSAEEPDDETAVYVAYEAEDTGTLLYYIAGSSCEMEVNEGQYYVEELISPYGYALDSAHTIEVESGENENVGSTDIVDYQQITLTKKSLTADGSEDTGDSTEYEYMVRIEGLDSGQEVRYTTDGTTTSDAAGSNGRCTLDVYLSNGETAVIELPVGATYTITEAANSKIASYTVEDADENSAIDTIASAFGANDKPHTALSTATETADSGEDVTVTFTNTTKTSVPVTLAKISVDEDGETDTTDTNYYSYTVTVSDLDSGDLVYYTTRSSSTQSYKKADSSGTVTISGLLLKGGESIALEIPVGATYTITEEANSKTASYVITNSAGTGSIAKRNNSNSAKETALSTEEETAENGEVITVTFTNTSLATAYGTLNFDANGGSYRDGTEITTITYEGVQKGYDENTSGTTQYDYESGSYAEPAREGYSFLGWSYSSDAETAFYDGDADYSVGSAALASIESLFPELTNVSTTSYNRYYLTVPGGSVYDDDEDAYTWYYFGDYTESSSYSEFEEVWDAMTTNEDTGLTVLESYTAYEDGDAIWELAAEAGSLIFYTNSAAKENAAYMLPDGTYYAVYETESGEEVPTAQISLSTTGASFLDFANKFASFNQTLYAVWERDYGYLSLQKTADNEQNIEDPDMDGALYAVHEEDDDGEIVGYFITDEDGAGYAASTSSSDRDTGLGLTVAYDSVKYYATSDTAMYLGAGTYYVEELVAPDWYEAKDIGEVTVTKDNTEENPALAAYADEDGEPVLPMKVTLTKYSQTADGSEDTSDTLTYTYKITIGNLESGDVIAYTLRTGKEYTTTAGSSGKITLSLSLMHGEEIWFIIPAGATYKIQETSNQKIASYAVTDANADSKGEIVSASGANDTPYTSLSTETETADSGEDVTVTFTNTTVEKVQVCLFKQSVDGQGDTDPDDMTAYDVYVSFANAITGDTITYSSDTNEENSGSIAVSGRTGSATVSIQSGETITFSNVPVGAEYYFREESNDRIASYEITDTGSSGSVEGNASAGNEEAGLALTTSIQTAESGEKTTVAYTNMADTANVRLLKVDADGEPLAGAVFALYDAEDTLLAEGLETGEDGYTDTVEDLAAGEYYFVETEAPDGYTVSGENPIDFTITEDDVGTTVTVTVTDNTLQILPNAGGTGIWLLLLMSFGAFCAAVLILRVRRTGIAPV